MRATLAVGVVAVGLALIVSEAAMRPTPDERLALYGLFGAAVVVAGLVCWWLTRVHRRLPSLRWTMLLVATSAVIIAGAVVAASAAAMVLAPPGVRVVVAALAMGTGLGLLVAIGVTGPLTADLRQLAATARRVADGDRDVRTRIDRRDEVGALADSLDRMVDQLARFEEARTRDEASRHLLIASIGHDLRTPLASLRAAIEAIQDGVAPDPDRYLRSMAGDVDLLSGMVDDLFVLVRLRAGDLPLDRTPLDLFEVADGAVEALIPLAASREVSVACVGGGAAPVAGDLRALDRVLRNLLDNAVRHAPADTRVQVTVETDGSSAVTSVRDEGPGFPPEFVARAFDLSARADAARSRDVGGAGLGLAIAREFVDAHGGEIWIEQTDATTVAFRLPLAPDAGRAPPPRPAVDRRRRSLTPAPPPTAPE